MRTLYALLIGFAIDMIIGDPHQIPHPVVWIGKLISFLEQRMRKLFSKTATGERMAGLVLWLIVVIVSAGLPALLLWILDAISPWLALAAESVMCWQILAARSLQEESMKVYYALKHSGIEKARQAVSMIVGRDTEQLDEAGVTRAAVETVAENTSDGVIAPLLFMAVFGAPFGFFYKAVNTMDSMLGYTDSPYTHIGLVPARADDILNFIPARLSALLMLLSGWILKGLCRSESLKKRCFQNREPDLRNGWKIFLRDRYKHASPNSAQTESVCAGLLDIRLAGDARYHGHLHKKPFIGDPLRETEYEDIPRSCSLMYGAAIAGLVIFCGIRAFIILL